MIPLNPLLPQILWSEKECPTNKYSIRQAGEYLCPRLSISNFSLRDFSNPHSSLLMTKEGLWHKLLVNLALSQHPLTLIQYSNSGIK